MITIFEALVISAFTIITYTLILTIKQTYEESRKTNK
jgi:hypothetical protein